MLLDVKKGENISFLKAKVCKYTTFVHLIFIIIYSFKKTIQNNQNYYCD